MSEVYAMKSLSAAEEYIKLEGSVSSIRNSIMKSEIQFLSKQEMVFGISDSGGLEVPDFIYYEGISLISNDMKVLFDSQWIDYVYYIPAAIQSKKYGIHESFWVIVPPRIDCVDLDKSIIKKEWDFEDGLIPMLSFDKLVILPKLVGRFELFKVFGVLDNNIYVTEKLYRKMVSKGFEGIEFISVSI